MNAPLAQRSPLPRQPLMWLGVGLGGATLLGDGGCVLFLLLAAQSMEGITPFLWPMTGGILGIITIILWLQFTPGSPHPRWGTSDQETSPMSGESSSSSKEPSLPQAEDRLLTAPPGKYAQNANLQFLSYPSQIVARTFVLPKEGDDPERCDDKHAQSISPLQQRYAVADGVSASFLPGRWAQIIAASFVERERGFANSDEFIQWLTLCSNQWHTWVKTEWIPEKNKIRRSRHDWERDMMRGAQTTFVGCSLSAQVLLDQRAINVHVTAVGDASFFLVRPPITQHDQWQYWVFPQENPEDFGSTPDTLATAEQYLQDAWKVVKKQTYATVAGDVIILATDALAHWILTRTSRGDCPWPDLLSITDYNMFRHFIEQERYEGRMEMDDTTLMVIPLK